MRICVAYPTVKGVSGGGLRTVSCVIFIKQKRQRSRSVPVSESWGCVVVLPEGVCGLHIGAQVNQTCRCEWSLCQVSPVYLMHSRLWRGGLRQRFQPRLLMDLAAGTVSLDCVCSVQRFRFLSASHPSRGCICTDLSGLARDPVEVLP